MFKPFFFKLCRKVFKKCFKCNLNYKSEFIKSYYSLKNKKFSSSSAEFVCVNCLEALNLRPSGVFCLDKNEFTPRNQLDENQKAFLNRNSRLNHNVQSAFTPRLTESGLIV